MNLDRVTITGADDSVKPADLVALSRRFPFVEWGVLVSKSQMGTPRFPTDEWIFALQSVAKDSLQLSLHVCGRWVRQLLVGVNEIPPDVDAGFRRIQLNFHAERNDCSPRLFERELRKLGDRQYIFQIDGVLGNRHMMDVAQTVDAAPLFDTSGGAGILPRSWPIPMCGFAYQGYAGGLGPDSLAEQLLRIAEAAGDQRIWIDMERRVRSGDDAQFELAKVERCLEIAAAFISSPERERAESA